MASPSVRPRQAASSPRGTPGRRLLGGLVAVVLALGAAAAPIAPARADAVRDREWWVSDYGIDKAWKVSRGAGVKIAIIDSGVADDHPDLKGAVSAGKDFSGAGDDGRKPIGSPDSLFHGTAVAGVAAGRGHSGGAGVMGVAPEAQILSASVWLGGGMPKGDTDQRQQVADAVRWSVDQGASVINLSLGWEDPSWPASWDSAFLYAAKHDVVIVACVGNKSQGAAQAWSPSTVPGVLGVGSLRKDGEVSEKESAPGIAVDLMAPGEDMAVPWYSGGYGTAEGSSFAAPFVAGVAALIRSAHPELKAADVVARLTSTAEPVKGHKGRGSAAAPDPVVGYGRIDPMAALGDGETGAKPAPADDLASWVAMHRRSMAPTPAPLETAGTDGGGSAVGGPGDGPDDVTKAPAALKGGASGANPIGPIAVTAAAVLAILVLGAGLLLARKQRKAR